jgi:hypothetical protein
MRGAELTRRCIREFLTFALAICRTRTIESLGDVSDSHWYPHLLPKVPSNTL